ncbi:hypothetical protein [Streptomyces sp. NPDC002132]
MSSDWYARERARMRRRYWLGLAGRAVLVAALAVVAWVVVNR